MPGMKVPPTADPASGGRKKPASGGVGNERSADMAGAFSSKVGPGKGRNSGTGNLSVNSKALKAALP